MVTLIVVFIGCADRPEVAQHTIPDEIPPGIPIIELPVVDLRRPVPRVENEKSPMALGRTLQRTQFGVRMEVHRSTDAPLAPFAAIFSVGKFARNGDWVATAECHIKATNSLDEPVVHYVGVCPAPNRAGPSQIEVRFGNDAYLVRSTRVE